MAKASAGILLYRRRGASFEVFLAHPGGPYWAEKDEGVWTIPKGLIEDNEEALAAAVREFEEETGLRPDGPYLDLGQIKQRSGKIVHGWACEGDADPSRVRSNQVRAKWKGSWITVPEVDRCEWFDPEIAMTKINPAQAEFIVRLARILAGKTAPPPVNQPY